MIRATDFDDASKILADGMNAYLKAVNRLKPGIWPHYDVSLDITANTFRFKVGSRKWQAALGGTDSLYFLMAYHYGLLTLSVQAGCHHPGLSICPLSLLANSSRTRKIALSSRLSNYWIEKSFPRRK